MRILSHLYLAHEGITHITTSNHENVHIDAVFSHSPLTSSDIIRCCSFHGTTHVPVWAFIASEVICANVFVSNVAICTQQLCMVAFYYRHFK